MTDWFSYGLYEKKGVGCSNSIADAIKYLGSESWYEEAKKWFSSMKTNKDLDDKDLKLAEEFLTQRNQHFSFFL